MYSFNNDYSEGAHPKIIEALTVTNLTQTTGYGLDSHTKHAISLIKKQIEKDDVDIHLMVGGTQVNLTALSAFLRPHQAAICAETGHINVHETGAIEATGHKIITVKTPNGKLTQELIEPVINSHTDEHMVQPKLIYISNSTEIGTIYTKTELTELYNYCQTNNLLLYMDGARLGSALTSNKNDLTLAQIAQLTDAFYIGGTKNGALFGEAFIICNHKLKQDFRYFIKQKGGMLAKGRLLGIQFEELFKANLFFDLATHANQMAQLLKDALTQKGYPLMTDSSTNQQFPILPNTAIQTLSNTYEFSIWEPVDDNHSIVRFVTSWATQKQTLQTLIKDIQSL